MATLSRTSKRRLRHRRLRRKISGTPERPRMAACITGKHMYIQFIDDTSGRTLAAASSLAPECREKGISPTVDGATELGRIAGQKAIEKGIKHVVFDRGGHRYYGRIKAIADAARETGLQC